MAVEATGRGIITGNPFFIEKYAGRILDHGDGITPGQSSICGETNGDGIRISNFIEDIARDHPGMIPGVIDDGRVTCTMILLVARIDVEAGQRAMCPGCTAIMRSGPTVIRATAIK